MSKLTFNHLVDLYVHTRFAPNGRSGQLYIASDTILQTLKTIESNDEAHAASGISFSDNADKLILRREIEVGIASPKLSLGVLASNLDNLLNFPEARITEPSAYFIIEGKFHKGKPHTPKIISNYRVVLSIVGLIAESAAFLDKMRQEVVFIRDKKFVIPINYSSTELERINVAAAVRLQGYFEETTHREQKLEILADAIAQFCDPQPVDRRFAFLIENLDSLADAVRDGYKLFASSFSYSKIRSELENAKIDYIGKIHKTFSDIQGQLLGIPVATVIVASQLKVVSKCGLDLWANSALLFGAWVFVGLLGVAIINQWITLDSIALEIGRQKTKLKDDYAAIGDRFTEIFNALDTRIFWHRIVLGGIAFVAALGAASTTLAFNQFVEVEALSCILPAS
jgi:hypothetical protein